MDRFLKSFTVDDASTRVGIFDDNIIISDRLSPVIVTQPYREISIKAMPDDFYSNLIEWFGNMVFFANDDRIYYHDFYCSSTRHLLTITNSVITSLKGCKFNNTLVVGTSCGDMYIVDLKTKTFEKISMHRSRIGVLAVDNHTIISGSRDKRIRTFDLRENKAIYTSTHHSQEVCGIAINKNGTFISTGGNDNRLFIFDYRRLDIPLKKCTHHKAAIKAISWSQHSPNLFVSGGGTADKTVKLWDTNRISNISSEQPLVKSINYGTQICNLKWMRNNQLLSTHGYSKDDIRLCNMFSFKYNKQFLGHKSRVIHFSISEDERFFVTGSADRSLKFWETDSDSKDEIKIR